MSLTKISPHDAKRLIAQGATLIDIRSPDEHIRESIPGACNRPLDTLGAMPEPGGPQPVIFHCKTGMRTGANAARLAAVSTGEAYILDGGLDAWKVAGLPVRKDDSQPLEIMRQVQIAAGSLILLSIVAGFFLSPSFFLLAGLIGAGLTMAGITGWCGLAKLLGLMPWNRRAAA